MTTFYGIDYEKITVSDTAVALNSAKVENATRAVFVVEGSLEKYIRVRYDGTSPTASNGLPFTNQQSFAIEGIENLQNFSAIRANDEDVTLHVSYESYNVGDAQ